MPFRPDNPPKRDRHPVLVDANFFCDLILTSVHAPNYRPPTLPDVVTRLMRLVEDRTSDYLKVERVVSRDGFMAAKIVGLANSAAYARGQRIASLRNAISRLGLGTIRDLAFQVAMNANVFRVAGFESRMHAEQQHALGCALLAREVCAMAGRDSEQAFLGGLLHDIGFPIAFGILVDWAKIHKQTLPTLVEVDRLLNPIHAEVGARICAHWGLPDEIRDAVYRHHLPVEKNSPDWLAGVVFVANLLAHHTGIGRPKKALDTKDHEMFLGLAITHAKTDALFVRAQVVADQVASERGE